MGKAVVFHDHRGSWRITGATNNLETSLFIGLRQYMFRSYRKLSLIIPSPTHPRQIKGPQTCKQKKNTSDYKRPSSSNYKPPLITIYFDVSKINLKTSKSCPSAKGILTSTAIACS